MPVTSGFWGRALRETVNACVVCVRERVTERTFGKRDLVFDTLLLKMTIKTSIFC